MNNPAGLSRTGGNPMADPLSEPTVVPISPAVAGALNDAAPSAHEQSPTTDHNAGSKTSRDVENPWQPGVQPRDGQQPLRVRDIRVGNKDGRGLPITHIYAMQLDQYGIYHAGEVMVQFADD